MQITPDPLEISEIDFEKYMTVTSTIPILCDHDLECCLTFKLNVNKTAGQLKVFALDRNGLVYLNIVNIHRPTIIQNCSVNSYQMHLFNIALGRCCSSLMFLIVSGGL